MLAKQGPRCRAAILDSPRFSGALEPIDRLAVDPRLTNSPFLPDAFLLATTGVLSSTFSLLSPSYSFRTLALIIKHLRSLRLLLLSFLLYSLHYRREFPLVIVHLAAGGNWYSTFARSRWQLMLTFRFESIDWEWFVKVNFSTKVIFPGFLSFILVYIVGHSNTQIWKQTE